MFQVVAAFLLCANQPTVTVWSYQTPIIHLRHCHTWITATDGARTVCISWAPADHARIIQGPVRGANWTHQYTLDYARAHGTKVRSHGPYAITHKTFEALVQREKELSAGLWEYQTLPVERGTLNCVRATCVVGALPGLFAYGDRASRIVANELRGR